MNIISILMIVNYNQKLQKFHESHILSCADYLFASDSFFGLRWWNICKYSYSLSYNKNRLYKLSTILPNMFWCNQLHEMERRSIQRNRYNNNSINSSRDMCWIKFTNIDIRIQQSWWCLFTLCRRMLSLLCGLWLLS